LDTLACKSQQPILFLPLTIAYSMRLT